MGIPSFYRQLSRRFPHLISRGHGPTAEWLCLDFNCAMYDVLRKYSAEHPYAAAASKPRWEAALREAIAAYMGELVALAAPTRGVYVSCDGVVCAAKRKQQRLRRFKGPWIRDMEASITGGSAAVESWDQNALTPGSAFMADLDRTLTDAGARLQARSGLQVTVSSTSEPGEGEHKILRFLRDVRPASCTIYGLDADLILLAMLLWADTGASVRLLREAQEFETKRPKALGHSNDSSAATVETRHPKALSHSIADPVREVERIPLKRNTYSSDSSAATVETRRKPSHSIADPVRDVEWRTLDIVGLKDAMGSIRTPERVRDFVATMTLLGNDFLPRPLTKTVRDDGIPSLLQTLERAVWSCGHRIVGADGTLCRDGLLALVSAWAATEESDMVGAASNALRAMHRSGGGDPMQTWNELPATWGSLTQLLGPSRATLVPAWRDHYTRIWMAGTPADYCAGLAWTWDYYSGRPVEQGWHFAAHLPPLWSAVATHLRSLATPHVVAPPVVHATPLPAWVHLLSVLPATSARRLLAREHQRLMEDAPHFWPTAWSLFDVGRTQMWECEPVIPVIPEVVLRGVAG